MSLFGILSGPGAVPIFVTASLITSTSASCMDTLVQGWPRIETMEAGFCPERAERVLWLWNARWWYLQAVRPSNCLYLVTWRCCSWIVYICRPPSSLCCTKRFNCFWLEPVCGQQVIVMLGWWPVLRSLCSTSRGILCLPRKRTGAWRWASWFLTTSNWLICGWAFNPFFGESTCSQRILKKEFAFYCVFKTSSTGLQS